MNEDLENALSKLGEVIEYGWEFDPNTGEDLYIIELGEGFVNDWPTLKSFECIHAKYLSGYPFIKGMEIEKDKFLITLSATAVPKLHEESCPK